MARYIDANKLQEDFEKIADEPDYMHEGETWQTGIYLAGTITDKQPTADVVEVVRCKDCKKSSEPTSVSRYELYCNNYDVRFCERDKKIVCGTHFCSYGERRDT